MKNDTLEVEPFYYKEAVEYKKRTGSDYPLPTYCIYCCKLETKDHMCTQQKKAVRSIAGKKGYQTAIENGTQNIGYGTKLGIGFQMLDGAER